MPSSHSFDFFLNFDSWSRDHLSRFLSIAQQVKIKPQSISLKKTASLLFFESSTRTRVSFELAAFQEGYYPSLFSGKESTSLEKGETLEDTFENILAMQPDLVIVRAGESFPMQDLAKQAHIPILNAGWGVLSHPSQALLDLLTLKDQFQDLQGLRLLVIGDVKHSRVFQSLAEVAKLCGIEMAIAAPRDFQVDGFKTFDDLEEGLRWAQVAYFLRIQKERHSHKFSEQAGFENFFWKEHQHQFFLQRNGFVMHPGPVNYGSELSREVCRHPQSLILKQVANGVFARRALLRMAQEGAI